MFTRQRQLTLDQTGNNSLSRLWGEGGQHDSSREGRVRGLLPTEPSVAAILRLPAPRRLFMLLLNLTLGISLAASPAAAQSVTFERDVLPILTANCLSCHGGTSIYTQAGLDLRTINSVMRGSLNGPVVVKGSPEKSLLYQKVSNACDAAGRLQADPHATSRSKPSANGSRLEHPRKNLRSPSPMKSWLDLKSRRCPSFRPSAFPATAQGRQWPTSICARWTLS